MLQYSGPKSKKQADDPRPTSPPQFSPQSSTLHESSTLHGWPLLAVGLPLLVVAASLVVSGLALGARNTIGLVDHTRDVVLSAQHVLTALNDAERAGRAFVFTADKRYLEQHQLAVAMVHQQSEALRFLIGGDPRLESRIEGLESAVRAGLAALAETLNARKTGGEEAAAAVLRTGRVSLPVEAAGKLVSGLEEEENALLQNRIRERERNFIGLGLTSLGCAGLGLVLIFVTLKNRRRDVQMLRESENQFRTLADSIPQLCWMSDEDGSTFWYNQRASEFTGLSADQLNGFGWKAIVHPLALPDVLKRWRSSVRTGLPFEMVFPIRAANGEFRPFLTRALPVHDENGKVVRWCGTNTEFGEQQKVEKALRESEERLRLAQQVARIGTFEWNIRTGELRVTPELEALYGLSPGGFEGQYSAWEKLIHPDDLPATLDTLLRSMDQGDFNAEWRSILPDGTLHWFASRGHVFKDATGQPDRLVGVNIDISERKRVEQSLRDTENRYRMLAEALPAIIFTMSDRGELDYVNARWQEYTGLSPSQSMAVGLEFCIHPDDLQCFREHRGEAMSKGQDCDAEFRLRRADGVYRWFRCRAVPLRDERGQILRWLGVSTDTDDEKKAEERLRHSRRMEAMGRLAGGVAHDFNNLLTAVLGYNSLILDRLDTKFAGRSLADQDPELISYLEDVKGATERAIALTRQLLSFSRRDISEPLPLDLNSVVQNMRKLLGRVIGEDIEIVTKLSPNIGRVLADPLQVDQIVMNLAVNARDAMPDGGRLSFETARITVPSAGSDTQPLEVAGTLPIPPGEYVLLKVTDNGCGIDDETSSHLFEPFFTTKEKGKGTGLGLSIVYQAVKQNGGFITLESEPHVGTTFNLYFPCCMEADDDLLTGADSADTPPDALPGGTRYTILLVEDEPTVRQFAAEVLTGKGFRVLEAGTPAEAIELVRDYRDPIALLLSDVILPGMRGPELVKHLRELRPALPVMYMSGYADSTFSTPSVLAGARLLKKPFTSAQLVRAVHEDLANALRKAQPQ